MIKNKLKDIEIINLLRKRDSHIIEYIISRYFKGIRNFVVRHNGTAEDAQDVFQDALIKVLEIIDNDPKANFDFGTVINNNASYIWLNQKSKRLPTSKHRIKLENLPISEDNITDLIQDYLNQLKPEIIMALFMYYQDKSYEEIAKRLGWDDAALAKNRINSAKTRLKKVIKESEDYKNLIPSRE